jgi:peptidoglycan-associated lipoprotein
MRDFRGNRLALTLAGTGDVMRIRSSAAGFLLITLIAGTIAGCKKKVVVTPPAPPAVQEPAPPAPSVPTATFTAEPAVVEPGQAVTLKWSSTNASEAKISGVGVVAPEGNREVRPEKSTSYELVVTGPGGSAAASATVTVMPPLPPPAAPPIEVTRSLEDRISELSDAYFDFDQSAIREDARVALTKDAEAILTILSDFPEAVIVVEGHCDDRGSPEYNIGLGDRRAEAVAAFLKALGVGPANLQVISYGKERPQCADETESCWQKNRRAHFAAGVTATR